MRESDDDPKPDGRAEARRELLRQIEQEARETASYTGRRRFAPEVMRAIADVPREQFVPASRLGRAYANVPLSIGYRQTISQPFIVALMTDLLEPRPVHRMLEIGTGSGYQAAVLSLLVDRVYTVERVPELAEQAARRLARLGYDNVECRLGDGNLGWPEHARYDGIVVTAGAREVPPALLEQLAVGARLIIPVTVGTHQMLRRIERESESGYRTEDLLPVAFVPLI